MNCELDLPTGELQGVTSLSKVGNQMTKHIDLNKVASETMIVTTLVLISL